MITKSTGNFGDLKKFKVEIDEQDVTDAAFHVAIFQDVFTPTWNCQITMNDTTNLLMRLPIKPGSKVRISLESETESPLDDEKEFEFVVHRIGDKKMQNQVHLTYVLFCADKAFLINQGKRVSKAYSDQKATAIASSIVSEFIGGSVDAKASEDSVHVIIPNWSPFNAVAWCLRHATDKGAADYVFFQSDTEKFTMKPMEHLYSSRSESCGIKFMQTPADLRVDGDFKTDYSVAITSFEVEHHNGLSNMASGFYRNKKLSYDIVNKKWEEKTFKFGDDCPEDAQYKAWTDGIFEESEDTNVSFMPKHPGMHEKPTYLDQQDTWEPSRKSAIQKLNQEKLYVQLPGSVGIWKAVGKNCEVDLFSHQDMDENEKFDKYRKGRYLIAAVAHLIDKEKYIVNLEMVKKRMEEAME